MAEVLTFGETMMVLSPAEQCSLRYNSCFFPKIAGAESNTAIGICKLGHSAEWISCIGTDEIGQFVLNSIRAEGVSANLAFSAEAPTGIMFKQILPSEDTRVYYYRKNSAFTHFTPDNIPTTGFQSCKIFHATGITPVLSANSRDTLERMISICKQQDIAISFDPNIRLTLWRGQDYSDLLINIIKRANYVMMGLKEAEYLFHLTDPVTIHNFLFSVKISIPLENTGVYSVFATSFWPFSLIFSLARRNEGNFFQAVPTTLSSSLAEVRLASLVAWA